jgi:DNA-directed RNA polymerase specialized sigma24 family protein
MTLPVWDTHAVAERLRRAARIAEYMPNDQPFGYHTLWPQIVRQPWEELGRGNSDRPIFSAALLEEMLEVNSWMQLIEVEQRHLLWMRAKRYRWDEIARQYGCCERTIQQRWKSDLQRLTECLNMQKADRSS